MNFLRGFTLIELMVTIAIMAIIVTMAAPSFSRLFEEQRLDQSTQALINQLAQARSQAATARVEATVNLNSTAVDTATTRNWSPTENIQLIVSDTSISSIVFRFDGTTTLNQTLTFRVCNTKLNVSKVFTLGRIGSVVKQPDIMGTC
ncbi:hypothetical protein GCM10027155_17820 [Acinetobacter apis]|uniref:Type IV fimbrial biogenesis protein FimT/type IV fimbrial biogenesis protein FimU n=1 Tax=Acinetobacter apis TaxID=1229165 RepID=A0A217EH25_9GAMM|nr:prepilin-type N-terminal cleavage/methylation domain-containing protein [Acinetobacter apis]SNQ29480.1 type IV fimbrial biogenesis protein FimT/type IV fimbrial biogenesis protein FimU [Acinetobacter apis]